MIQFNRRQVMGAGGLALLVTFRQQALHAQTRFPEQRIRVILPSAAGGVGKSVIRLLASGMERTLGQKLVIESKPGAAGNIGTLEEVVRANADGYTLLVGATNNFAINQFLTKMPFDPLAALTPIGKLAEVPIVFFSNPSVPRFATLANSSPMRGRTRGS